MEEYIENHRDGSIHAKGQTKDGLPHGYWEWYRPDGTKKRSGYFDNGKQTGNWTTYDQQGKIYKVTNYEKKKSQ